MPIATFLTASVLFTAALTAQSLAGRWECTVTVNGNEIPFRMEFSGDGASVAGNFFNGDERVASTGGQLQEGALRLNFDQYASRLEAMSPRAGWKAVTAATRAGMPSAPTAPRRWARKAY